MTTSVDLKQLSIERHPAGRSVGSRGRRRPWITRYAIPVGILAGFMGILGWTLRDEMLPATPVTVVPVIAMRSTRSPSNAPLFQAAGWVEPRPSPTIVTSLLEGVVERVTVIEGQEVASGQPVAYLIRRDAEIAVRQAEAELRLKMAEQSSAEAQLESARTNFEEPVQRQAEVADAEAQLAKVQTELSRLPSLLKGAQAKSTQAGKELEVHTKSAGTASRILVDRAQRDWDVAKAAVDEYREQIKSLELERVALVRRRDVLKRRLALKVDEKRQLSEAESGVKAAEAQRQQAEAALESAQLRLERTTIFAPSNGKVLSLMARPGSRLMGMERAAMVDASTVLTLYDPQSLQIRADVRLEEVSQVLVGQAVLIDTPAVSGALKGHVITTTSVADIQKNTLQVKVAVDDPPAILRPDMLVQVTFLAPPSTKGRDGTEPPLRLMIPRSLVDSAGEQSTVWLVDPITARAIRRIVVLGNTADGDLIEATSGLHVGDRVIVSGREALRDGARIQIRGDDRSLGHASASTPSLSPVKGATAHHAPHTTVESN